MYDSGTPDSRDYPSFRLHLQVAEEGHAREWLWVACDTVALGRVETQDIGRVADTGAVGDVLALITVNDLAVQHVPDGLDTLEVVRRAQERRGGIDWTLRSRGSDFVRVIQEDRDPTEALIRQVHAWVMEQFVGSATQRIDAIRAKVEALIGTVQLKVLENDELLNLLDEREHVIEQLRGQVATLQAELRRNSLSPRRVRWSTKVIAEVLLTALASGFGGAAGAGVIAAHQSPAVTPTSAHETVTEILTDCEQLDAFIQRHERSEQPPEAPGTR
jgi:hypothetical protein